MVNSQVGLTVAATGRPEEGGSKLSADRQGFGALKRTVSVTYRLTHPFYGIACLNAFEACRNTPR